MTSAAFVCERTLFLVKYDLSILLAAMSNRSLDVEYFSNFIRLSRTYYIVKSQKSLDTQDFIAFVMMSFFYIFTYKQESLRIYSHVSLLLLL